jgi:4-hydroxy-3-methylbut-2-en-1-yl diphosphate reductase
MKIILANPRGFCAGVNMAIDALETALRHYGSPLYVYHEIVHNRPIVERFEKLGVVFVDDISEVPAGGTVLYSAHGVSPVIREQSERKTLRAIDATCPLVTKVHKEAIKFAKEGYTIVLIGHEGHDEVIGTMGEAPANIILVEDAADVEALTLPPDAKLAFLTQTTLSVDEAKSVIDALKKKYPQVIGPNKDDICYATQNRQDAVKQLAPRCDLVLVIGSRNSSNSNRLVEVARQHGARSHLIDNEQEVREEWLEGVETVGITSGASAPEELVQRLVDFFRTRGAEEVAELEVTEEDVRFMLPKDIRELLSARS